MTVFTPSQENRDLIPRALAAGVQVLRAHHAAKHTAVEGVEKDIGTGWHRVTPGILAANGLEANA